jgi:hypothetical protein
LSHLSPHFDNIIGSWLAAASLEFGGHTKRCVSIVNPRCRCQPNSQRRLSYLDPSLSLKWTPSPAAGGRTTVLNLSK